ncbi:MAG: dephospho-CoA kinase [Planctomycetes bacterium]|nr:dephospho-CoA kinase [Planctomycetota bacterium]
MSAVEPTCKKPIIGLAGGIGAGKSSVARILESLGAAVIDSDQQVRELYRDPQVVSKLRQWWGDRVIGRNGGVDRQAVAAIVFKVPAELERLERLLYPRLARGREEKIDVLQQDPSVRAIVLDSPKLFEVGLDKICDAVIFVDADWTVRSKRVADSRGWDLVQLQQREKLLISLDRKRAMADHVVENHADTAALRGETRRVFSSILAAGQTDVSSRCS